MRVLALAVMLAVAGCGGQERGAAGTWTVQSEACTGTLTVTGDDSDLSAEFSCGAVADSLRGFRSDRFVQFVGSSTALSGGYEDGRMSVMLATWGGGPELYVPLVATR